MRPQFRRRLEQKTDYNSRLALVKSGKPRMVVRVSLSHTKIQFVKWNVNGDTTIATATTMDLPEFGWKSPTGNIPAAYLAGVLAGVRAKEAGVKEAVLDIGLAASTPGNRIYAALKGAIDAGVVIAHGAEMLPSEDRINGKHIIAWASAAPKPSFSKYGVPAHDLPKHIADVKTKILSKKV